MNLYLIRHATAAKAAASDEQRELTQKGRKEARILGEAFAKMAIRLDYLYASPLVRAQETAEILASTSGYRGEILTLEELKNGVSTPNLLQVLKPLEEDAEVGLVGHMPSLAEHLAYFLQGSPDRLSFDKGGAACVFWDPNHPQETQLRWFVRQEQLREMI
ncbi:phosphohistidine phosphatase SixA [Candidatus Methylacidithermus pantelleriae]|uniref:Phosphohistidine phosphatase SixA n=1 Tax=Candidatus Methylacidithermus pantelleriae TaxID=2744239 RepID=A0A8J2FXH3_9BACT|nr:phosphohistidine phosphatase SixA [Candidatus Methylacidithermus pantelleriae]CAF0705229.1 Phosphohistidine phosphatase SixA [Candidatus Methylacidithermus pantelleriae]